MGLHLGLSDRNDRGGGSVLGGDELGRLGHRGLYECDWVCVARRALRRSVRGTRDGPREITRLRHTRRPLRNSSVLLYSYYVLIQ